MLENLKQKAEAKICWQLNVYYLWIYIDALPWFSFFSTVVEGGDMVNVT